MTVVILVFIFCFVIAKPRSESLGIHPEPRVHFGAQPVFISISHTVELRSMRKHGHKSCLFFSTFIQPCRYCTVFWMLVCLMFLSFYVCVSICFLQHKQEIFFHLALALPQVFNFSVLCLAVNAFICFDIGGFFSSCWSSVQLFCFTYNFLYIHQCYEVIVMLRPTYICVLGLFPYLLLSIKMLTISLLNYTSLLTVDVLVTCEPSEIFPRIISSWTPVFDWISGGLCIFKTCCVV